MIHRNTYINAPTVLDDTWQTRKRPDLFFAGQVSGVEGYVESAASGLIAGRNAARLVLGLPAIAAPRTTAIGALGYYVSHADPRHYEPSNITFGIMPPLDTPPQGAPGAAAGDERSGRSRTSAAVAASEPRCSGRSAPHDARETHVTSSSSSFCATTATCRRIRCAPTRPTSTQFVAQSRRPRKATAERR